MQEEKQSIIDLRVSPSDKTKAMIWTMDYVNKYYNHLDADQTKDKIHEVYKFFHSYLSGVKRLD